MVYEFVSEIKLLERKDSPSSLPYRLLHRMEKTHESKGGNDHELATAGTTGTNTVSNGSNY